MEEVIIYANPDKEDGFFSSFTAFEGARAAAYFTAEEFIAEDDVAVVQGQTLTSFQAARAIRRGLLKATILQPEAAEAIWLRPEASVEETLNTLLSGDFKKRGEHYEDAVSGKRVELVPRSHYYDHIRIITMGSEDQPGYEAIAASWEREKKIYRDGKEIAVREV